MILNIDGKVLHNVAQFTGEKIKKTRSVYNALKIEIRKDYLSVIATQGFMLCIYKEERTEPYDGKEKDFILELNKIKFDKKAIYKIDFKEDCATLENTRTGTYQTLKYITDIYPKYKSVIPKENNKPNNYVVIDPDYLVKLKNCMPEKWSNIPYQDDESKLCLWIDGCYKVVILPVMGK